MKVVVIQEPLLQPDLTPKELTERWNGLKSVKGVDEFKIYTPKDYPSPEEYYDMIGDADAVLGLWVSEHTVTKELLSSHPNLKYIATLGHGFGEFDREYVKNHGITITNTIYGAQTIAEFAWALLMEVCHRVQLHSDFIKNTDWSDASNRAEYTMAFTPQIELYGLTCGIIGLGAIGYAFAKMAQGFGMKVISYSRHKKEGAEYDFIEQVSFDELLKRSDVISIHSPLTPESADMINKDTIAKMKDGVILINTARGGIIVEEDLYEALKSGKIFGAGLDVLREEPATGDNPLFHLNNATITGHIAWLTKVSKLRTCDVAIENLKNYLEGKPTSVIS